MADLQGGIVVFIHGVLMSGRIMSRLQARIEYAGWQTAVFDYPSRSQTVARQGASPRLNTQAEVGQGGQG